MCFPYPTSPAKTARARSSACCALPGVRVATVDAETAPARVDFGTSRLHLMSWRLRSSSRATGSKRFGMMAAESNGRQHSVEFVIAGMTCNSCAVRVQQILARQPGVANAEVNFATMTARVIPVDDTFDQTPWQEAVARGGCRLA